jgi:putative redox protein
MVRAESAETPYLTSFTNGGHRGSADNTPDKGGQGNGFRPHELLEAALASCMSMWLRMYADNHQVPVEGVSTSVALRRDQPGVAVFEYAIALRGPLTPEQKHKLLEIAQTCPVRKTLAGTLSFSSAAAIAP